MSIETGSSWFIRNVEIEGGGFVNLKVGQVEVFAPNATVTVDNGFGAPVGTVIPGTRYLRGEIEGKPGSIVALMQTANGNLSGLMTDGNATWSLHRGSLESPLQAVSIEHDPATVDKPFQCGNEELPGLSLTNQDAIHSAIQQNPEPLPSGHYYQVTVAIETDYALYANFGSPAATTNYIGNLFNYITGIYEVELQTRLLVGDTFLYSNSSDPWVESGGTWCRLAEFGRYWRDNRAAVSRTIAHFLSGEYLGGGVAWVSALCEGPISYNAPTQCATVGNDYVAGGFGVSANLSGTISTASGPAWDAVVVAHEIGHNFSSPHTHCYGGIGGSSSPVDACYNSQNNCWAGAVSLPGTGSLTGGTSGGRNGTIMSYCHQRSGGIGNIAGTLGLGHTDGVMAHRVADKMFSYTQAVAASNSACIPTITPQQTLTVIKNGTGSGTVSSNPAGIDCGNDCTEDYDHGTSVNLTASATGDSTFAGWSGACSGTDNCSVTMDSAKSVTATFNAPTPQHSLTVTKGGSGTVTSNPAGIDCGADCQQDYDEGTSVTLSANPTTGHTFSGWSGACSGTGNCDVIMNTDKNVMATFTPGSDTTDPTVTITSPTSDDTYATSTTPITLDGTASDNVGVTQVTWSNDRGGSGTASGTTSWSTGDIDLQQGANVITIVSHDGAGNTGSDTLTVTYHCENLNIPNPGSPIQTAMQWTCNNIAAVEGFEVGNGGEVVFTAGATITLGPGFQVGNTGRFQAIISAP